MKEYKVISPSLGWKQKTQKLEDILNSNARESWVLNSIVYNQHGGIAYIILERDKNR
ncbi:MAG: DUF4177 domain-containing protein [Bacteroidetes bacterium]|nr:DUF4177 domain-containing protein [Bacteroidota bacterium]